MRTCLQQGKSIDDIVKEVLEEFGTQAPAPAEQSYAINIGANEDEGNRQQQYVYNGKDSRWLPFTADLATNPFRPFVSAEGRPYASNGTDAVWLDELFQAQGFSKINNNLQS